MLLPKSRKEAQALSSIRYNTGKPCRNGHVSDRLTSTGQCCKCKSDYQSLLRQTNPEAVRAKEKSYYDRNSKSRQAYQKQYVKDNWEDIYKRRKPSYLAQNASRRAVTRNATLPGYTSELKDIYSNCPYGHHVDHIVPLRGKNVCGLHVPWNLQYLPAVENQSKSNSYNE